MPAKSKKAEKVAEQKEEVETVEVAKKEAKGAKGKAKETKEVKAKDTKPKETKAKETKETKAKETKPKETKPEKTKAKETKAKKEETPKAKAKVAAPPKKEESESDSESDSDSSEEEVPKVAAKVEQPKKKEAPKAKAAPAKKETKAAKATKAESSDESDSESDSGSESNEEETQAMQVDNSKKRTAPETVEAPVKTQKTEENQTPSFKPKSDGSAEDEKRVLFVGNLSFDSDIESFTQQLTDQKIFPSDIRLASGEDGRCRGFGHIEFNTAEEAQTAQETLNGYELDGRSLRVEFSTPKGARAPRDNNRDAGGARGESQPSKVLFVGQLNYDSTVESVQEAFAGFGTPCVNVRIIQGEDGQSRGFGYAEFNSAEEAQEAIKFNGSDIDGRNVKLDFAEDKRGGGGGGRGGFGGGRGGGRGGFGGGRGGRGGDRGGRGGFGGGRGGRGGFGDRGGRGGFGGGDRGGRGGFGGGRGGGFRGRGDSGFAGKKTTFS